MKTDERDAIDTRVKEMLKIPSFLQRSFPPSVMFYIKTILLVQNSPSSIFSIFSIFFYSFLFNNILVVHFYLLAYLYHLLLDFLHYSSIFMLRL
jgi:hypothetical protein